VLNGDYNYYYDSGQLNVKGIYENGKKKGVWTWYTNKGQRDQEGTFKDDLQHGSWTYWFPTGELSIQRIIRKGRDLDNGHIYTLTAVNSKKEHLLMMRKTANGKRGMRMGLY
jgi:hypothetical protein